MYNDYVNVICYKYRLCPSKAQEAALNETLVVCRLVYNSMVHERTVLHEQGLKAPTFYTQVPAIARWKKDHAELTTVHSQVLQNVARRVELAFQAFFRRVKTGETPGYPRLKGRGQYDSFTFPQSGFKIGESSVWLSLQGKQSQVKAKIHRAVVGTVKTCTVRRYGKKWFVCFSVEQEDNFLPPCADAIGLDAGLNSFMACLTVRSLTTRASSAKKKKYWQRLAESKPRRKSEVLNGVKPTRFCLVPMSVSAIAAMTLFTRPPEGWSTASASSGWKP